MTSNAWHTLQSSLASSAADIKSALDVRAYFDEHPDMPEVTERICQAARREFAEPRRARPERPLAMRDEFGSVDAAGRLDKAARIERGACGARGLEPCP